VHILVGAKDLTWAEQEAIIAASVTHPRVPPRLHAAAHPVLVTLTLRHISRAGHEVFCYVG